MTATPPAVLLVCEQDAVAAAVERALRDAGLLPVRAHPRDDLAARLEAHGVALALLDTAPHEDTVLAAVSWLRSRGRGSAQAPRLPIVLMGAGRGRVRSAVDALRHEADDWLQRPLPAAQLVERLCRYLHVPVPVLGAPHAVVPGDDGLTPLPPGGSPPHAMMLPGLPGPVPSTPVPSVPISAVHTWTVGAPPGDPRALVLQPPEGHVADGAMPALLWSAARQSVTCRLDLANPRGELRSVWFHGGQPVAFASALPGDGLLEFLETQGLLSAQQARDARTLASPTPVALAGALVRAGFLKASEGASVVRAHLSDRVMALMDWPQASYRCVAESAPEGARINLEESAAALTWRGIRRRFPRARVEPLVGGADMVPVPVAQVDLSDAGLSDGDWQALGLMDGRRTLREVSTASGLPLERTLQLALLVLCGGAFRAGPRGVSSLPPPRDAAPADAQIDRARVEEQLRRCREADYFTMLGLPRGASPAEVTEALEQARRHFQPERFASPALMDLQPAALEILDILDECEDVLGHDARRGRYVAALA